MSKTDTDKPWVNAKADKALRAVKANMKVLQTMRKVHEDLENFHRRKVLCKEMVAIKIKQQLELAQDTQPLAVPSGLQVNQVLNVPKPLQCCLHSQSSTRELYVAHYGAGPDNGVYTWSKPITEGPVKRSKKILNCRITNLVFVSANFVYLASCDNLTLRVYNNKFREQSVLQLQYSILSMLYDEQRNEVVSGSIGYIQKWRLSNCLHNPPILMKETQLVDTVSGITPWITFLHHNKEQGRYIALTGTALFVIDSNTFEQVAFLENRHRFPLTVCISYVPRQYLVTGAKDGDITAWNMSMASFPYVGCFTGHLKKIINIITHPNEPLLITASEDSTIRFWRIETFQETHRFDVLDAITSVCLVGPRKLYYTSSKYMCLLDFNYFHSIFTLVGAKCTTIERIAPCLDKPARIMLVGDDGGIRIVSPTHGNILTMLFPIVTHKPLSYTHDPLEHQIYILLQCGGVMVVSTKTNPCKTAELLKPKYIDEAVICLGLVYLNIDEKDKSLLFAAQADGRISLLKGKGLSMKTMTPGRGVIKSFQSNLIGGCFADFLTYNTENTITLWKVRSSATCGVIYLEMIDDIQLNGPPSHISFRDNYTAFSYGNKLITMEILFRKRGNCTVRGYEHVKDEMHKDEITQLQSCCNLPLFATSSLDGRIKIWDSKCNLIRELVFDKTLSGLCFANARGDILVGFQANLHFVALTEYMPSDYLKMLLTGDRLADDRTEYCISFDPLLKFWFDPDRVPTIWLKDANNVRSIEDNTNKSRSGFYETFNADQLVASSIHPSSIKTIHQSATPESGTGSRQKKIMTPEELRQCRRNSLMQSESQTSSVGLRDGTADSANRPLSRALTNEIITILSGEKIHYDEDCYDAYTSGVATRDGSARSGREDTTPAPASAAQTTTESAATDTFVRKYWPCAPDGFIPNSIIRNSINPPRQAELNKVEPWKPRRMSKMEDGPLFDVCFDDDDDYNKVRMWHSDEEEDDEMEDDYDDDFSFTSRRRKFSLASKKPTPKTTSKKTSSDDNNKRKQSAKKIISKKLIQNIKPPVKKDRIKIPLKTEILEEVEIEAEKEVDNTPKVSIKNAIPDLYAPYYKKAWFPKNIGFDLIDILMALISTLDPEQPFALKEIFSLIKDINKAHSIPEDCMKPLLDRLLELLDHESGQVRHYTVKMLLELGESKKSVILKLVRKLDDPVIAVREEVKTALEQMAGIDDTDTLIAVLKELGEFRHVEVANDVEVMESMRENIISKRDSFMRKITENESNITAGNVFGWISKFNFEINEIKKRNKGQGSKDEITPQTSVDKKVDSNHGEEKVLKEKIINDWVSLLKGKVKSTKPQTRQKTKAKGRVNETKERKKRVKESDDLVKVFIPAIRSPSVSPASSGTVSLYHESEVDLATYTMADNKNIDMLSPYFPKPKQQEKLFQPDSVLSHKSSSSELQLINKLIIDKEGGGRQDIIKEMAPRVLEKFKDLDPKCNLFQSLRIAKRKKETFTKEHDGEKGEENDKQAILVQNFQLKIMEITNDVLNKGESCGEKYGDNEESSGIDPSNSTKTDAVFLKRAVLATAISALRSKRQNTNSLPEHGLLGNQALNDINQLLRMFQDSPKTFDSKSLNTVSDLVQEIQEELGMSSEYTVKKKHFQYQGERMSGNMGHTGYIGHTGQQPQETTMDNSTTSHEHQKVFYYNDNGEKISSRSPTTTRLKFVSSPLQSFPRQQVRGVRGERILSSLRVLPRIPRQPRNEKWLTKSIPERNGNLTVLHSRGHTNYGSIALHWTTWTNSNDMKQNTNDLSNTSAVKNITKRLPDIVDDEYNQAPYTKKQHLNNNQAPSTKKHIQVFPPKLRSLTEFDRGSGVYSANYYGNIPAPPNTALAFSK